MGDAADAPSARRRVTVRVDPRVEVFSMLQRVAGLPPYAPTRTTPTPYERRVDAKLATLAGHPAVASTQRLAEEHGIGFDGPMCLAVHLSWPGLEPRVPLRPLPPGLDDRWQDVDVHAYLGEVRAFVAAGDLEGFFAQERAFFDRVEASLDGFVRRYDDDTMDWLEGYSGTHVDAVVLVQGLLTENGNYGPSVRLADGTKEAYEIVVLWKPDEQGVPRPEQELFLFVVHEAAHSYLNPVFDGYTDLLQPSTERLFEHTRAQMAAVGYGDWTTLLRESIVRAATRAYLEHIGADEAAAFAEAHDRQQGFTWVGDVIDVLDPPLDREDATRLAEVFDRHAPH